MVRWKRAWMDTGRKKQASLYRLIGTSTLLAYSWNKIPAKIIILSPLPNCDVKLFSCGTTWGVDQSRLPHIGEIPSKDASSDKWSSV